MPEELAFHMIPPINFKIKEVLKKNGRAAAMEFCKKYYPEQKCNTFF